MTRPVYRGLAAPGMQAGIIQESQTLKSEGKPIMTATYVAYEDGTYRVYGNVSRAVRTTTQHMQFKHPHSEITMEHAVGARIVVLAISANGQIVDMAAITQ